MRDPYVALRIKNSGKKEHTTWQDLAATPLLLYGDHESTAVIEQYLKGKLGQVEPKHQVTEDSTLIRMVAEGLGLTVMPQLAVETLPENVEVAALPEPFRAHHRYCPCPESAQDASGTCLHPSTESQVPRE